MEVMRQLPTPFSSYDARSPYQPWESRKHVLPLDKDQPAQRPPYDFTFRYPPSPPMERQSHTSLPPISTLLANMRDAPSRQSDRPKRDASHLDNNHIDPRLKAPPTPPSRPLQHLDAPRSAPLQHAMPATSHHSHSSSSYPTPHESRQGSISSYTSRPPMHHHRLSSSSSWSNSSARAPSPQSAVTLEPPSARSTSGLYPPPSFAHSRSVPEYSPRTPQSPPATVTPSSHVSDYERSWPHHHPQQYAPVPAAAYAAHGPPGTQTLHLSPVSAQAPTSQPERYACPQCAKAFSRPSSLRIHVHSHTGEKPFVCPHVGCGKAFSVRSNMKRHQRGCHVDGVQPKDMVHDEVDEV
ncbi:MAG: hypothetical protein Q9162_007968 [Coniocarpon cinnabarinum]